ncbi:MAG: DUF655 domain-containing protein [Candidatus Hadarchaeia archaeon]
MSKKYEDYGYILDYLPQGHHDQRQPAQFQEPIVQLVGEEYFTLLEAVPHEETDLPPQTRVYIGRKGREKIERIKRRINYDELTSAAKSELSVVIEKIIEKSEEKFLRFFNEASPITSRYHQFELIPGIGKKLMWSIIEEREKKDFESFEDLQNRVKSLPDPTEILAKRIEKELKGEDKYSLFVRRPKDSGGSKSSSGHRRRR